jgi:flagellar basal body-associated protein FliL
MDKIYKLCYNRKKSKGDSLMKKIIVWLLVIACGVGGIIYIAENPPKTAQQKAQESIEASLASIRANIVPKRSEEEQAETDAAVKRGEEAAHEETAIQEEIEREKKEIQSLFDAEYGTGSGVQ